MAIHIGHERAGWPGPCLHNRHLHRLALHGGSGAVVATDGSFPPAFVIVAFSGPRIPRIRRSPATGAFLDGVNVASLALMATVTWQLGRGALTDIITVPQPGRARCCCSGSGSAPRGWCSRERSSAARAGGCDEAATIGAAHPRRLGQVCAVCRSWRARAVRGPGRHPSHAAAPSSHFSSVLLGWRRDDRLGGTGAKKDEHLCRQSTHHADRWQPRPRRQRPEYSEDCRRTPAAGPGSSARPSVQEFGSAQSQATRAGLQDCGREAVHAFAPHVRQACCVELRLNRVGRRIRAGALDKFSFRSNRFAAHHRTAPVNVGSEPGWNNARAARQVTRWSTRIDWRCVRLLRRRDTRARTRRRRRPAGRALPGLRRPAP